VPFLIERKGAGVEHSQDFDLLHQMRDFLQWRRGDAILLAEANVPPTESVKYFGENGDRLQMMLNFPVNQRLFYAMATADLEPLKQALQETAGRPHAAQWVHFLRSHDELDLGRLTDEERQRVFEAFGPEKRMQLYARGIRRRIAPMLGNDRRKLELAYSLQFTLPGTPMILWGDEIGLGDNLDLPERDCARTPMQWTSERHGGFTLADKPFRPVNTDDVYGYETLNVARQRRDPSSLLNWTERRIRMRKECPEITWGHFEIIRTSTSEVLVMRYDWRGTSLVTLHNFSDRRQRVEFDPKVPRGEFLVDVFDDNHSRAEPSGAHLIDLPEYAHRWLRVGAPDNALNRSLI
jgi:maltose alpha-D-glucosyltransferase/alpha-amylase